MGSWLGLGVGMSMPPMGVAAGVIPIGVAPSPGVAAGVAPRLACPAGVSSHLDRPFFAWGVAPTAGVSPGAQPGVALPSTCTRHQLSDEKCLGAAGRGQEATPEMPEGDEP